jgi:hypothetical protein
LALSAGLLAGQSIDVYGIVLGSHLRELLTRVSAATISPAEAFASDLLRVAVRNHQPTRNAAIEFAQELLTALSPAGSAVRTDKLTPPLVAVLRASGSTSISEAAFQQELLSLGIEPATAAGITSRLRALANEVRATY